MLSHSPEQTQSIGQEIGRQLTCGSVVVLEGDLGAGKTTLLKGLAKGVAGVSAHEVSSPTFVYMHIYEGEQRLYHFDLYRLKTADEFLSMGFDEYLYPEDGITCIEWAERIPSLIPSGAIRIRLSHIAETTRKVEALWP